VHEAFTGKIEPGMCVLDVGAHVGLFTSAAALSVGPSGPVVAFEPSPETVMSLHKHVALNGSQTE